MRVSLATGAAETLLRGMSTCDGIRTTPWATILATEETSDGGAYEILDPMGTINHTVTSRGAGTVTADDGKTDYVVIRHSSDNLMPRFDDYPTDDLIKVTGFRVSKP